MILNNIGDPEAFWGYYGLGIRKKHQYFNKKNSTLHLPMKILPSALTCNSSQPEALCPQVYPSPTVRSIFPLQFLSRLVQA